MENIMCRIKALDGAIKELGTDHPFVKEYRQSSVFCSDTLAYLKLCIITAALNEGWKPTFAEDEYRYYPHFHLYTQEQIDKMSNYERAKVWLLDKPIDKHAGIAFARTYSTASNTGTDVGSRFSFKTRELAEYAGKQFIMYYADYCLK